MLFKFYDSYNLVLITYSAVFLYYMFYLFLRDPFSRFRDRNSFRCRVELVKLLPVHRYSVHIFSYSGPSRTFGSDGKQKTAWGVRIVALSISSNEQTQ